jgi:hypothetical protein
LNIQDDRRVDCGHEMKMNLRVLGALGLTVFLTGCTTTEWIGMLLLGTLACAELPLLAYRFSFGVNRIYPWIAAPLRALAYSPTILAGGHGAMPFLTGPSLWMVLNGRAEPGEIWLVVVPALVTLPAWFIGLEVLRRSKVLKNGRSQAPRVSVTWKRGLPLLKRIGVDVGSSSLNQDQRERREREIHGLVFYFGVGIVIALLIALSI